MTDDVQTLEGAISDLLRSRELELFDLELRRGVLCVTVARPPGSRPDRYGPGELGLDELAEAARAVSDLLDASTGLAPGEPYELEVSSPGVERRLRRVAHFQGALGERVALRTKPDAPGPRRIEGVLVGVDDGAVSVATEDGTGPRSVALSAIDRAHTVFDWRAALAADRRGSDGTAPGAGRDARTTSETRETRENDR